MVEISKPDTLANNIRHSIVSGINSKGKITKCVTNEAHDMLIMVFVMEDSKGVDEVVSSINRVASLYDDALQTKEITVKDLEIEMTIKGRNRWLRKAMR